MVADQVLAVALVAPLVVVGAGVDVVGVVAHDGPGDAQQGVRDGDRGLLLVALAEPAGQAAEPGAGPGRGAPGRPGRFDHGGAQVRVALAGGGLLALAGGLVIAGRQPGPGGQPGRGGEPGHVAAGLGDDDLGGPLPDAGDGDQPGDEGGERRGGLGDQGVQLGDLGGEVVVGVQVQQAHLAVARGEPAVAGHRQLPGLAAEHAQGQPGQPGRVPLPGDQRPGHRPPGLAQHVAGHRDRS